MNIIICDRCGCEIKPSYSVIPVIVGHEHSDARLNYDLCPVCAYKLKKFLNNEDAERKEE